MDSKSPSSSTSRTKRPRLDHQHQPEEEAMENDDGVAASSPPPSLDSQPEREAQRSGDDRHQTSRFSLVRLLESGLWEEATRRARDMPAEVHEYRKDPSPLALASRLGAPYECVKAILEAAPQKLRHVLDSRGTPLHEAIVCENIGPRTIQLLLATDERLETNSDNTSSNDDDTNNNNTTCQPATTRAALLQDVDGFTPLHLLIRYRFQYHIMHSVSASDQQVSEGLLEGGTATSPTSSPSPASHWSAWMSILEMLVKSCPEAVVIPDRGEYEEPPIVYAVKVHMYARTLLLGAAGGGGGGGLPDDSASLVESRIYDMVACMLRHNPSAASRIFTGYRGQYTALHSAVFHGRHTSTIELLLRTEAAHPSSQKAALLPNTQGEIPLHFCAMRGERPWSVALIASAAPEALLKRDASGLTPFHWLWVRFVSTLLTLEDHRRGQETTILLSPRRTSPFETTRYNEFAALEQGDFDADLQLIKRMDPPVDFLRMRHIPLEVLGEAECFRYAHRSVEVLHMIRERHEQCRQLMLGENDESGAMVDDVEWTREEVVISLFWTKTVALLEAASKVGRGRPHGSDILVHTAFASPSSFPSIAYIVASLFPDELCVLDDQGRLPIHYAANRAWHAWDWPRDGPGSLLHEPTAAQLLHHESLNVFNIALNLCPPETLGVRDRVQRRLVLHILIDTVIRASARHGGPSRPIAAAAGSSGVGGTAGDILQVLRDTVQRYPLALFQRDGVTKLYPFQQAAATATEQHGSRASRDNEELSVSITYELLRESPNILTSLVVS